MFALGASGGVFRPDPAGGANSTPVNGGGGTKLHQKQLDRPSASESALRVVDSDS